MSLTKVTSAMTASESLSVFDFGAVGDGVTDDAAAIQLAFDYSKANNAEIFMPTGHTFLINSTINPENQVVFDGRNCTILKNFDGVGIQCTGGGNPNTLKNVIIQGYGAGAANGSTATSGHGIEILSNAVNFENVVSVGHKGHGIKVDASSPNMNGSEWGRGSKVQSSNNDGHGFFFTGSNDNVSNWPNMYLYATGNQLQGIFITTGFMGRQWQGYWYLEDNSQGAGYFVGGQTVSNYIGNLRFCDLMIYAEENAAGITKDIYFDTATEGNNLTSTRLNRWEEVGVENTVARGGREQSWNLQHRFRTVKGINVTGSTDYVEDYFQGSSSSGELGTTRRYGSGKYELRQRKTSNGKIQVFSMDLPYKTHAVYDDNGKAYNSKTISRGTETAPTAAQVGDSYGEYYQAYGSSVKNLVSARAEVYSLGSGSPGGSHIISAMQAGGSTLTDVTVTKYNSFAPVTNNSISLGVAGQRWTEVFAVTGTINTSDQNEKQQIRDLSDTEKAVAIRLKGLIKAFKFNTAVEAKGDDARIHVGVIAQDVRSAFEAEGLDAHQYGVFCSDTLTDDNGVEQTLLGIRYEELYAFIISTL